MLFPVRYNLLIDHSPHRPSENMLIRANTDGTYSANWTPGAVGLYTIHVTIDGIEIGMSMKCRSLKYFPQSKSKGSVMTIPKQQEVTSHNAAFFKPFSNAQRIAIFLL